jgi:hypothetical protein
MQSEKFNLLTNKIVGEYSGAIPPEINLANSISGEGNAPGISDTLSNSISGEENSVMEQLCSDPSSILDLLCSEPALKVMGLVGLACVCIGSFFS